LLAPRTTSQLDEHLLSAVRDFLFDTFAAVLHIGGSFSIRNLRMRHAMVTGTHIWRAKRYVLLTYYFRVMKWRKMRREEHVAHMGKRRDLYRVLVAKPEGS